MRPHRTKVPANARNRFGWVAERSNATVLPMSQQGKWNAAERERMVSPQRGANKTAGLKDRRIK